MDRGAAVVSMPEAWCPQETPGSDCFFMNFQRELSWLHGPFSSGDVLRRVVRAGLWARGCVCSSPDFWQKFKLGTLAFLVLGSASLTPAGHPHQSVPVPLAWCKSEIWKKR